MRTDHIKNNKHFILDEKSSLELGLFLGDESKEHVTSVLNLRCPSIPSLLLLASAADVTAKTNIPDVYIEVVLRTNEMIVMCPRREQ